MKNIDNCHSGTRREFVTAAGVGAVAALAGCTGDEDNSSNPSPDQPAGSDSAEADTQNDDSTDQDSGSTEQGSGTAEESDETRYEDPDTHNNEQEIENILDETYYWFEMDDPNQQFRFPEGEISIDAEGYDAIIRGFNYISNREPEPSNEFTEDVEAVYLAFVEESSGSYRLRVIPVSEEREAYESGRFSNLQSTDYGELDAEVLTRFLDENVLGASDVSDDMPQEYLNLVG